MWFLIKRQHWLLTYEAAMNNAGKQFRSTERLAENLKIKIGRNCLMRQQAWLYAVITNLLKDLDDTFTDLTDSGELQNWVTILLTHSRF